MVDPPDGQHKSHVPSQLPTTKNIIGTWAIPIPTGQTEAARRYFENIVVRAAGIESIQRVFSELTATGLARSGARWTPDISSLFSGKSTGSAVLAAQSATRLLAGFSSSTTLQELQTYSLGRPPGALHEQLANLTGTARLVEDLTQALLKASPTMLVERGVAVGIRGWNEATRAVGDSHDASRLLPLEALARGTVGVASAGLLLTGQDNEEARDELLGPHVYGERLRDRLGELDPNLPTRLDGAWERVSRVGPDAASQAAHSLMELLDWTLRIAAPDADVLSWHASEGRPASDLNDGAPTRALRLRWLLRDRPQEAKAIGLHLRALSDLVGVVQSYKHNAGHTDVAAVARLIPTVEGLLIFVLL